MFTCIANYKPLTDRLSNIKNQLQSLDLPLKYVINIEPPEKIASDISYVESPDLWRERTDMNFYRDEPYRPLRRAEISLAYKHIVFLDMLVQSGEPAGMILEDDVIITPELTSIVAWLDTYTSLRYDCIFLGGCCPSKSNLGRTVLFAPNRHTEKVDKHILVRQDHPASRCTDGYIITADAAKKILTTIKPFVLPIDFELSYHFKRHNMIVYHLQNPVINQDYNLESSVQNA